MQLVSSARRSLRSHGRALVVVAMASAVLLVVLALPRWFSLRTRATTTRRIESAKKSDDGGDGKSGNLELEQACLDEVARLQRRVDELEGEMRAARVAAAAAAAASAAARDKTQTLSSSAPTTPTTPPTRPPYPANDCALVEMSSGRYDTLTRKFTPACAFTPIEATCLRGVNMVFMGDSQMKLLCHKTYSLFEAVRVKGVDALMRGEFSSHSVLPRTKVKKAALDREAALPVTCRVTLVGSTCGEGTTFFGFPPHPTLPMRTCKACTSCVSKRRTCASPDGSVAFGLDYLGVEGLDDALMPSAEFNTTQENVINLFLSRVSPPPDLVVVNAGLHLLLTHSAEEIRASFRKRLLWEMGALQRAVPNAKFVWVGTTYDMLRANTTRATVEFMNAVAKKAARQLDFAYVDAQNLSGQMADLYGDGIHLVGQQGVYYNLVRDLIASWYCGGGATMARDVGSGS